MDFWDPVSELISVSPKSSNRSLGITRSIRYDRNGLITDRPRTTDFSVRLPITLPNQAESAASVMPGSGVVFQRPLPDGLSEELVDVRLPGGATRRDVWEWVKGLGNPSDMDPGEPYVSVLSVSLLGFRRLSWPLNGTVANWYRLLKGPIVAQGDFPASVNAAEGSRVTLSSHRSSTPVPVLAGRRGFQETIFPTRGGALPASVDTTRIEGRASLAGGSQVDSIIQGLRDVASDIFRNSSDGLLESDDAAHGRDSTQHTQTRGGLTTPSQRFHPAGTYAWNWILQPREH